MTATTSARVEAVRAWWRHDLAIAVAVFVWTPSVLLLDRGASLVQQDLLGVGTWVLLLVVLRSETPMVRAQTAVVIAFATVVEYTCSPLLQVYVYRLHNVPAFVPPGHGLVYLAAYTIGRSRFVRRYARQAVTATVVAGGLYALWGLSPLAPRLDVLGAFWFCCLLGFLRWGRSQLLYVGAFLIVTYLELMGTGLGTWAWQAHDPTGIVAMGNPPSGAAGGYGWFDLAAVTAAPWLLARSSRLRRSVVEPSAPDEGEDGVVEATVRGDGPGTAEH